MLFAPTYFFAHVASLEGLGHVKTSHVPFHFVTSFLRAARGLSWFFHQNWKVHEKQTDLQAGSQIWRGKWRTHRFLADGKPRFCYARTCDTYVHVRYGTDQFPAQSHGRLSA
jgi:hypothetical protein